MNNEKTRMFECTQIASFEERNCKLRSDGGHNHDRTPASHNADPDYNTYKP